MDTIEAERRGYFQTADLRYVETDDGLRVQQRYVFRTGPGEPVTDVVWADLPVTKGAERDE